MLHHPHDPYDDYRIPTIPHRGYAPRSEAGRMMAGALRFAAGGADVPMGDLDVPAALGAAGDLLALIPGSESRETASAIVKGLALGAGLLVVLSILRQGQGR